MTEEPLPPFTPKLIRHLRTHEWLGLDGPDRCGNCMVRLDQCDAPCPGSPFVAGQTEAIHECLFPEEREPSGRLILAPCLVCDTTAMDAIVQMREDVLAIHKPTRLWTDSIVTVDDLTGERSESQEALYNDAGELVHAGDVRTVCEGCDVRNEVLWPCPTVVAVGGSR